MIRPVQVIEWNESDTNALVVVTVVQGMETVFDDNVNECMLING